MSYSFESWVRTDLGNRGAGESGFEPAAITVEQSSTGMIKVIDAGASETY